MRGYDSSGYSEGDSDSSARPVILAADATLYSRNTMSSSHKSKLSSHQSSFTQRRSERNLLSVNERFTADKRQVAGMLMSLSFCAIILPLTDLKEQHKNPIMVVSVESRALDLVTMIGNLCLVLAGILGTTIGYLELVHDLGTRYLTAGLFVVLQTAYIPYITSMIDVGRMARTQNAFIPSMYHPTVEAVRFVGALGILGILSWGFCFLGSIGFASLSLYSYQLGEPGDRAASYFRKRLGFYTILVTLAGFSQLSLGAYIHSNYGPGPLQEPVTVGLFTVFFPEIDIFVGTVYMLNGLYGAFRAFHPMRPADNDGTFQVGMLLQFLSTLVFSIIVQLSYADGNTFGGDAPARACLTLPASALPAYLDLKARTTPEIFPFHLPYEDDGVNEDNIG